jgi:ribosomal 30S subunit maturation factor RimM
VDRGKDETLIPFAQSYLKKIDLQRRRIEVDLPEGLRELNK